MANRVAVFRREHFNAAHRLYNPQWSEELNNNTFGKCSLPHYHGHNYEMEIKVVGEPDPATGLKKKLWKGSIIKILTSIQKNLNN
jgi:6-pyruvoyltetrahydropterin/6-carboxytetrahydropterin synthase